MIQLLVQNKKVFNENSMICKDLNELITKADECKKKMSSNQTKSYLDKEPNEFKQYLNKELNEFKYLNDYEFNFGFAFEYKLYRIEGHFQTT